MSLNSSKVPPLLSLHLWQNILQKKCKFPWETSDPNTVVKLKIFKTYVDWIRECISANLKSCKKWMKYILRYKVTRRMYEFPWTLLIQINGNFRSADRIDCINGPINSKRTVELKMKMRTPTIAETTERFLPDTAESLREQMEMQLIIVKQWEVKHYCNADTTWYI